MIFLGPFGCYPNHRLIGFVECHIIPKSTAKLYNSPTQCWHYLYCALILCELGLQSPAKNKKALDAKNKTSPVAASKLPSYLVMNV